MSAGSRALALTVPGDGTPVPALVLDALVAKLNDIRRTAALEFALRVGRLIVDEIYRGDLTRWREQREHELSFRQLAARTEVDLKMSPTTLYRAVALYDLCSRLSVELWRDFGAGHLRAVLGLPEAEQVRLLSMAKVEDWSARELYQQASEVRGRSVPRKRPTPSPLVPLFRRVLALLRGAEDAITLLEDESVRVLIVSLRDELERLEPPRPMRKPTAGRLPEAGRVIKGT